MPPIPACAIPVVEYSIAQGPTAGTEAAESLENSNEMSQPLNGNLQTNYSGSEEEDEEEGRAIVEGNFRNAKEGDEEPITNEKFWFFHFTMAAGSVYMAMLLTDWGSGSATTVAEGGQAAVLSSGMGSTSMWIKTISEWLALLLYTWTLIAPRCFPDRDFS
jgi:hypothetical protein